MTVILCVAVLGLAVSHALTVLWLHGLSGRVDRVEQLEAPVAPEPRTASTAADLDDLPDGSVIAAGSGTWQRAYDGWLICDGDDPWPSFDVTGRADRFTVLREGWGK